MSRLLLIAAVGAAFGVVAPLTPLGAALALLAALAVAAGRLGGWRGLSALALGLLRVALGGAEAPGPTPHDDVVVSGVVWEASCEGSDADGDGICRLVLADVHGLAVERLVVDGVFAPAPAVGGVVRLVVAVRPPRATPAVGAPAARTASARAVTRPEPLESAEGAVSARVGAALRERLGVAGPTAAALYRALLLGDKSSLTEATRWAFQDTGTAHLLAISGLHVALVGAFAYRLALLLVLVALPSLAQTGRPTRVAAVASLLAVFAYGALVAPSDATVRAELGAALVLGAAILARRADGRHLLALGFGALVLVEPGALLRPSFQLSFAAAAALVLGSPLVTAARVAVLGYRPGSRARRALAFVAAMLVVDALTFAATAPLALAWFGQLAPHGLWVNLLAVPAMALLVLPAGVGFAVAVLLVPSWADVLAPALGAVGELFVGGVTAAAGLVGPATSTAWPLALGVAATLAIIAAIGLRGARWPRVALGVAVVLAAFLARPVTSSALRVTAIDVGHGDAILIQPPGGGAALVDAGGTWRGGDVDARFVGRVLVPALARRGVGRLDLLWVTHGDRDHIGGAFAIAARYPVGELWLSPCTAVSGRGRALAGLVLARGGRVRVVAREAPGRLDWHGVAVDVLWPEPDVVAADGACRVEANDGSLVARLRYAGRAVLLTGDIEASAEAALVASLGEEGLRADVLKAPHHGSKTSSTPAFLAAVSPAYVVVSGLPGRPPMPPHERVLRRYVEGGAALWVTGRDGDVTVTIGADGGLDVRGARASDDAPLPGEERAVGEREPGLGGSAPGKERAASSPGPRGESAAQRGARGVSGRRSAPGDGAPDVAAAAEGDIEAQLGAGDLRPQRRDVRAELALEHVATAAVHLAAQADLLLREPGLEHPEVGAEGADLARVDRAGGDVAGAVAGGSERDGDARAGPAVRRGEGGRGGETDEEGGEAQGGEDTANHGVLLFGFGASVIRARQGSSPRVVPALREPPSTPSSRGRRGRWAGRDGWGLRGAAARRLQDLQSRPVPVAGSPERRRAGRGAGASAPQEQPRSHARGPQLEVEVELAGPEVLVEARPQEEPRLGPARVGDVAEIADELPAEGLAEQPARARLGVGVIAADEEFVGPGEARRLHHEGRREGVEGLHDPRPRQRALELLAEGVVVADREPGREALREVEGVRHVDEHLPLEVRGAGAGRDLEGRVAAGAVEDELAEGRRVREGALTGRRAHRADPRHRLVVAARARAHPDAVSRARERAADGAPDHASPEDADVHDPAPALELSAAPGRPGLARPPVSPPRTPA